MLFNSTKAAFGRHETFALRYSWLTKGYRAASSRDGNTIFSDEDATVVLGVGKNMVNAIRYWLQAAQLIVPAQPGFKTTPLGDKIFGKRGFDPYLEDEATIWLVHWLIASNPELATGWYWFFNKFHKPEFTSQEALDSPLSLLGLITQATGGRTYYSRALEREALPIGIFGFAIAQLFEAMGVAELPIENLMYAKGGYPAPGAVFRLTENAMITKLEKLIHQKPGIFEIRETAGIHQLYLLDEIDPIEFLNFHYKGQLQENAA